MDGQVSIYFDYKYKLTCTHTALWNEDIHEEPQVSRAASHITKSLVISHKSVKLSFRKHSLWSLSMKHPGMHRKFCSSRECI